MTTSSESGASRAASSGGRSERQRRALEEVNIANAALADKIIDYLFLPGIYLGPGSQRARAFRRDGSGISYLVGLTNRSHATTAEEFRDPENKRDKLSERLLDRLIIVLLPEPGEEGYDLQERPTDHKLLNLRVSRWVNGEHVSEPYPDFPVRLEEKEDLRLIKYGELLRDVVKALGLEDSTSAEEA